MDFYDEILKLTQEKEQTTKFITYLTDLINKKLKTLTELQFKNCLILTLAIWNPKFIDSYFSKGTELSQLDKKKKAILVELLKSEFRDYND